ncbi:MAG: cytochrome c [Betaproteobacteria bacterium]|nr:MAG: cytochrome c [Betaproteobacteria bacterium]
MNITPHPPLTRRPAQTTLIATFGLAAMLVASHAAGNAEGQAKAAVACNVCHGQNGISTMPNTPHLAGQPEPYVKDQLKAYRSGKRAHEIMTLIAKPLTDKEIGDLAAWYASIEIKATVKP